MPITSFFFSSRRRHTRSKRDWSSDVCSSDLAGHLASHGWTKEQYCQAFGLERGQSLEGPETRKLRAAAFTARLLFEPAVRQGSQAGRQRARSGDLTRDAVAAARGRPFPQQRRRKITL